jgi:hypothetical protein
VRRLAVSATEKRRKEKKKDKRKRGWKPRDKPWEADNPPKETYYSVKRDLL